MKHIMPVSIAVVFAIVFCALLFSYSVDSRLDQENRLRTQMMARLDNLQNEVHLLGQRIEEIHQAQNSLSGKALTAANNIANLQDPHPAYNEAELRDLVRNMVQELREERFAATRESQWQRLREWQNNRDGTYGKYDSKVNAITRSLELDYNQATYYYTLLSDYEEQARQLYEKTRGQLAGQDSDLDEFQELIDRTESEKRRLDESLDQAFMQTLSSEQASRYRQLPAEERGLGYEAGLSELEFRFSDLRRLASKKD